MMKEKRIVWILNIRFKPRGNEPMHNETFKNVEFIIKDNMLCIVPIDDEKEKSSYVFNFDEIRNISFIEY